MNRSGTIEALVVVRTYPVPSSKTVETSCTAGITRDREWVRLYPVPYRLLDVDKQFHKWQWISVDVRAATSDPRPESRRIDEDSIQILSPPLSTKQMWAERRRIVMPMKADSMCSLREQRNRDRAPTLGFIKPLRIERLEIEPIPPKWSAAEFARLHQTPLWGRLPAKELEKIPFKFSYRYTCHSVDCNGHTHMCSDWEMGEAFRSFRDRYGEENWEGPFRDRFERAMSEAYDTHFFVGTVNDHPGSWIIVGLWYPPLEQQGFLPLDAMDQLPSPSPQRTSGPAAR